MTEKQLFIHSWIVWRVYTYLIPHCNRQIRLSYRGSQSVDLLESMDMVITRPHFGRVKGLYDGGKQSLTVYHHWKTVLNCTGGRVRCAMHADHRRQSVWGCMSAPSHLLVISHLSLIRLSFVYHSSIIFCKSSLGHLKLISNVSHLVIFRKNSFFRVKHKNSSRCLAPFKIKKWEMRDVRWEMT